MRTRHLVTTIALASAPALIAWTAANVTVRVQPAARLWVSGTSTVRAFECGAKTFEAAIEATAPSMVADVLAGQQSVTTVELKVPVAQLDCRNDKMNEHMLKALKAKEFAEVLFRLDSYALERTGDGTHARLNGTLSLAGVSKPITMTAVVTPGADGALRVVGAYPLKMTEYGLQPPKLMLGALKVNELVTVNFDLLLKP
jgi:polyisoprenoid-binding protein YceI